MMSDDLFPEAADNLFTDAAEALMETIDLFQEAGLTNDEIRAELEARLG
jgi:DNA-binding transcriptional MerR regulator